jgi:glycosyltransferase involved in cell wall biosynthesis
MPGGDALRGGSFAVQNVQTVTLNRDRPNMRNLQKRRPEAGQDQTAATKQQQDVIDHGGTGLAALSAPDAVHNYQILFDISDLIYYIGHHPNLTGIQRVQASVILSLLRSALYPIEKIHFVSFDTDIGDFILIDQMLIYNLLVDLFNPSEDRTIEFKAADARVGRLAPASSPSKIASVLDRAPPAVLCLLGAAWVRADYFHQVLVLKRRFGTKFAMVIHDLIPIYARHTCDQGTIKVFEAFLRRALRHTDHFLCVSEHTAKDLARYARSLGLPEPPRSVTRNGSSFAELLPTATAGQASRGAYAEFLEPFVLFVSTIEGRKNHDLMFGIWRDMASRGIDVPNLICIGRLGWKSENFITQLIETNYLNGKIMMMPDVADRVLLELYNRCLFTVFPSHYEGWGLPVGEALAQGKICVCSDRASLSEVAGEFGVYIDIDDPQACCRMIESLITDEALRHKLEKKISEGYNPILWESVAQRVLDGCAGAVAAQWKDPYPLPALAYGREVSFGRIEVEVEGLFGDDLLDHIVRSRKSRFVSAGLDESSFTYGDDMRVAGDWSAPEDWGTWISYPGGEVVFGLDSHDCTSFYLFLRCHVAPPLCQEEITIFANGDRLWRGAIGKDAKDLCLKIYKKNVQGPWNLRIGIWAPDKSELYDALLGLDGRAPAIGLHRLVIVPEDDIHMRVEILQNLLLDQ